MRMEAKKFFRLSGCMLLTVLALSFISCQANELLAVASVETESRLAGKTLSIIEDVRDGDKDAYLALARKYRDGEGIHQSNVNALLLYGTYCRMAGPANQPVTAVFPEEHPFYPFAKMVYESDDKNSYQESMTLLAQSCPIEHDALYTFALLSLSEDPTACLSHLKELERVGSELSTVLQVVYHQERGDTVAYERVLSENTGRYPLFHSLLAEIQEARYSQHKNPAYLEKALNHYRLADAQGMLTTCFARQYLQLYEQHELLTGVRPDPAEMERLERVFAVERLASIDE